MNYVSFDIDGIMNNYPICWIDYIGKELNKNFSQLTTEEIKIKVGLQLYNRIKDNYRNSDYKANLDFNLDAKILSDDIISEGYKIIVSTSRPITSKKYPNLRANTELWLQKNNFHFDILIDKNYELAQSNLYENIIFHIDDEYKYALQYANQGVKSFIVSSLVEPEHNLIMNINNLKTLKGIWRNYV
jgi:hypothetical protein